MSVFDDPASLRGQSFGYGLAPLDPLAEDSETFVEATRLSLFIDEQGEGHVSGPLRLYAPTDPIDCDEVPTFSEGNLFIRGVYESIYRDVIPTTDGTLNLGSVSRTWKNVYAKGFVGDSIALSGDLIFKGAEVTDKFTISYEPNFSEVDYGETPFSTAGALVFNDELNGPVIWKVGGTGNGAFIIVNSDNFVSTGNAPSIARFYATTPGVPGPALQLYQGGIEKFQVNDKGADIYGNLTTESVNDGPLAGFRNRIINGNFDIWQRGTSFTGAEYGADRWFHVRNGSTHTVTRQAFTVGQTAVPNEPTYFCRTVVITSSGASNNAILAQRIEDVRTFAGQQVTVSFWAKVDSTKNIAVELEQYFGTGGSPSAKVTAIGTTKVSIGTSWQKVTVTATMPSISGKTLGTNNDHFVALAIWFDAGSDYNARTDSLGQQSGTFDIAQVQLEPGPVATPFEQRPIGTELALCKRYAQWVPFNQNFYSNAGGETHESTLTWFEMRANPNVGALIADPFTDQLNMNNQTNAIARITPYGGSAYLVAGGIGPSYVIGYRSFLSAEL